MKYIKMLYIVLCSPHFFYLFYLDKNVIQIQHIKQMWCVWCYLYVYLNALKIMWICIKSSITLQTTIKLLHFLCPLMYVTFGGRRSHASMHTFFVTFLYSLHYTGNASGGRHSKLQCFHLAKLKLREYLLIPY